MISALRSLWNSTAPAALSAQLDRAHASSAIPAGRRIILTMIVKNEAHVIKRCVDSVRPIITHWSIVDTGSTDGTQQLIRELLADLPGELHERPWKDFGHNRSEALEVARNLVDNASADFFFTIDADETFLSPHQGYTFPALTNDCYRLDVEFGATWYSRNCLVAARRPWRYIGVLHEYIHSDERYSIGTLQGPRIFVRPDGARSQQPRQQKYLRDAAVLEEALKIEPDNERYMFYLAQSYREGGEFAKAREIYVKRVAMNQNWPEETWAAQFQVARMSHLLNLGPDVVHNDYLLAHEMRPIRAEPLHYLAQYCYDNGGKAMALVYAEAAARIPLPPREQLFVERSIYQWNARANLGLLLINNGERERGLHVLRELVASGQMPQEARKRIEANIEQVLNARSKKK